MINGESSGGVSAQEWFDQLTFILECKLQSCTSQTILKLICKQYLAWICLQVNNCSLFIKLVFYGKTFLWRKISQIYEPLNGRYRTRPRWRGYPLQIRWKKICRRMFAFCHRPDYAFIHLIWMKFIGKDCMRMKMEKRKCKFKLLWAVGMLILRTMKWELHLNLLYMQLKSLFGPWTLFLQQK